MRLPSPRPSFEEVKQAADGYVVLDGEIGGICFVVCRASLIQCEEKTLVLLANDLEEALFPDDPNGGGVSYYHLMPGEEVGEIGSWGEERGIASDTIWLPKWLKEAGVEEKVQQIMSGKRGRLDLSISEKSLIKVLQREYHSQTIEAETRESYSR